LPQFFITGQQCHSVFLPLKTTADHSYQHWGFTSGASVASEISGPALIMADYRLRNCSPQPPLATTTSSTATYMFTLQWDSWPLISLVNMALIV